MTVLDSGGLLASERNVKQLNTQKAHIVVLSINDVYEMYPDQQGRGGIAQLATLLERERATISSTTTLLVTLNGDFLSGSQVGEKHKGAHMIALMNHLNIDYVVVGNHEFDFGPMILKERIKESHFKWLGANIKCIENHTSILFPGVLEYDIIVLSNGLKLGLFGICTPDTPQLSFPGPTVVFEDIISCAQQCVKTLESQGVDFIIALTHLSMKEDQLLARKVSGIDVQLGGHDHEPMTHYEGKTLIHKSGQNANWLARLDFQVSKSNELTIHTEWKMIANVDIPPEPNTQEIVHQYMAAIIDMEASEPQLLATLNSPLYTKTMSMRSRECNMGNLVADALRMELHADFGLINGGFIRGDKIYEAHTELTMAMINQEMPFPRPAVLVGIQAHDFMQAILQHTSKYPELSGSFPHLSGCHVTIDHTNPSIPRITQFQDLNGHDIDQNSTIVVATSAFIAGGGDGCTAWLRGTIVHEFDQVSVIVANYLMKQRIISYPEQEGRIIILD